MLSDDEIKRYSRIIKDIHGNIFAEIAGVSRNMAQKYKSGYSLPPLDKAVKIEEKLGIPARAWVDIRKSRENA